MKILALDLGTKMGHALSVNGKITSGMKNFTPKRMESNGMRYLEFKRWLTAQMNINDGLDVIYFEEVRRHAGTTAAHTYGGFLAFLTAFCVENNIQYSSVPVTTIKKYWTGKGNAGKPEMIHAAIQKGFKPVDDNESDALALLHWAMENH